MSLYGKEKIWFLIDRLLDERELTPSGQPISLHPMNDLNNHYGKMDFIQLAEKLEKEHRAIKLLNNVPTDQTYGKYQVELLSGFDEYVAELRKDPKYMEFIGEVPEPPKIPKISFTETSARRNGVITGKEKIQAIVATINDGYKGLVTGSSVTLYSGNLEQKGVLLEEQGKVLKTLANDEKVIKYTAKKQYKSRADIHPRDQVDIYEGSEDRFEADEVFEKVLSQVEYRIEVLSGFEDFANETLGDLELQYRQNVYSLKLLYKCLIAIVDSVVEDGLVVEDEGLDSVYVHLMAYRDGLLSRPQMEKWKSSVPEIYETLMGNLEDISEGWRYARVEVLRYYARLQKEWVLQGKPEFELSDEVESVLEEVSEQIERHTKISKQANDEFDAYVDELGKQVRAISTGQPNSPAKDNTISSNQNNLDKVRFDHRSSVLSMGSKECQIPDESLEYYVCKLVFKNRQLAANEDDILENSVKSQDSKRAVYDAMLRVNKKAKTYLGIEKLLFFKSAKVRINKKYQ